MICENTSVRDPEPSQICENISVRDPESSWNCENISAREPKPFQICESTSETLNHNRFAKTYFFKDPNSPKVVKNTCDPESSKICKNISVRNPK